MAVLKEWACVDHGPFESTHPICPELGCMSESVKRVFLTVPGTMSSSTKRFDQGIRKSSDMMGGLNFRSAKPNEAAYGGDAKSAYGQEVLWGDQIQKVSGKDINTLMGEAARPMPAPGGGETLTINSGLRQAATEMGITQRRIPVAGEMTVAAKDKT